LGEACCNKRQFILGGGTVVPSISIRLDENISQRLNNLSAKTGRTKSYYLREMIERGIEDMEDYYLAMTVRERIRKGEEAVHSGAAVRRDLDLED
jgi:RHH-type rel operon transcriptional repressor/antitoxin RelB